MIEPFLEPLLRKMRLNKIRPYLDLYPKCNLLDIGCGWEARLLKSFESQINSGVGIDFKAPAIKTTKLETHSVILDKSLPFADSSFDVVTMLAVLEHLDHPGEILGEVCRVLKPGGSALITVPSCYSKPVLEFLAFHIGVISPDEIRDHKRYYNKKDLVQLVESIPRLIIKKHRYFQLGFNNFLHLIRDK